MKISIDTKEDSHDEIRKVIKMLQHLIGEQEAAHNADIFGNTSAGSAESTAVNAFGALFGNADQPASPSILGDETDSDKMKIEHSDAVEIIPY